MKSNFLMLPFSCLLLLNCGSPAPESEIDSSQTDTVSIHSDSVSISDTLAVDVLSDYILSDTNQFALIIHQGSYHSDEIEEDWQDLDWKGIFKGKSGYYIADAQLSFSREYDPILDEDESHATGWAIRSRMKDESVCFVQMEGLKDSKIKQIVPSTNQLYPGDSAEFMWGGKEAWLFATGTSAADPYNEENFKIENYKLFLTAEKDGKRMTQLMISHESFDDQMTSILFIGDIDQDGYPDFLVDASRHYNSFAPTLYLSSDADSNHLLEIVAWHWSNGC